MVDHETIVDVFPLDVQRQKRDADIAYRLEQFMPGNWKDETFDAEPFMIPYVFGIAKTHQLPSDGLLRTDIPETINCNEFIRHVRDSNGNYQWIFDNYWTDDLSRASSTHRSSLAEIVNTYLAEISPVLTHLIQSEATLPVWQPAEQTTVADDYTEFLQSLHIPMLNGGPDMLLHRLGTFKSHEKDEARVAEIFSHMMQPGNEQHTVLLNTSGAGKTRINFEGLCESWGVYLTSKVDTHGHGSHDLWHAIDAVQKDPKFRAHLPQVRWKTAHERNMDIARHRFNEVLYARLLIMNRFCFLAKQTNSNGALLEEHKKCWLLLQVKPSQLALRDIFSELSLKIRGIENSKSISARLKKVIAQIREQLSVTLDPDFRLFCVIDEAQVAAETCLNAFRKRPPKVTTQPSEIPPQVRPHLRSDKTAWHEEAEKDTRRPILREILTAWTHAALNPVRVVVTGTGLSAGFMGEIMTSAVVKDHKYRTLNDTGGFTDSTAQKAYMESLMPNRFKTTNEAKLLLRLACEWLRGRFRFTATFMRQLMIAQYQKPLQLFQQYIFAYTGSIRRLGVPQLRGFMPTGGILDDLSLLPPERIVKPGSMFRFDRLKQHPDLYEKIRALTSRFYMQSDGLDLNKETEMVAVEYGFARMASEIKSNVDSSQRPIRCVLDEPLAQLALEQWLGEQGLSLPKALALRARLGLHSATHGFNAWEEYFAFYLSTVFDGRTKLSRIFAFPAEIPQWAKNSARLVALYRVDEDGSPSEVAEIQSGVVRKNARPSVALGVGSKYTDAWLKHEVKPPILFPTTFMGPDIMFVLELTDPDKSRIWVAVQSKHTSSEKLRKKTLNDAIRSVTPSQYYQVKPKQASQKPTKKMENAIEKGKEDNEKVVKLLRELPNRLQDGAGDCSLLRVVASWGATGLRQQVTRHEKRLRTMRGNKTGATTDKTSPKAPMTKGTNSGAAEEAKQNHGPQTTTAKSKRKAKAAPVQPSEKLGERKKTIHGSSTKKNISHHEKAKKVAQTSAALETPKPRKHPLQFYNDPGHHPIAELDISFMQSKGFDLLGLIRDVESGAHEAAGFSDPEDGDDEDGEDAYVGFSHILPSVDEDVDMVESGEEDDEAEIETDPEEDNEDLISEDGSDVSMASG
ncbi:hypothetical protein R3P38DRAFT_3559684 [Favolaschia claudopus]|uniref:Uncharacterized protein n=1 Tax=Favolaschia claudopus TaxID=2862362 RepID=A0AAW0AYE2_9AGAR